ncbi:DNA-binding MarR family transcriptional regulator [Rhizomicrobium palustre]|uniref:DNA-binding MarR family transcriptional regulator n=2 Tax=Rhizomicrobium palustre TaxID=189966 RepID=A0A846MU33_9PROT|nr:MarR family winged helix-turn-helix transcriptional regulator [Rhizomicrobium palustre]NIK87008.1 DNA-binding MarR family transcriptional regulator [Rhizomicrobium palustre]
MREKIRLLHGALLDIVAAINRPQRDEIMIQKAGISLERGLFPLLVCIERFGPIGVVELADRVGRDHTTVSRQVAKLESLGLAKRVKNAADGRLRQAVITAKGKAMTDRIDLARDQLVGAIFENWPSHEIDALAQLTRKFADSFSAQDGTPVKAPSSPAR